MIHLRKDPTLEKDKSEKNNPNPKSVNDLIEQQINPLREEVSSLKRQLQESKKKTEEIKSQKTQQICALTFKLANAIRQRESAEEEVKTLKNKVENLMSQLEESERINKLIKKDETQKAVFDIVDGEVNKVKEKDSLNTIQDEDFSDLESIKSDDTVLLCTSANLLLLQKDVENAEAKPVESACKQLSQSNSTLSPPGYNSRHSKDVNLEVMQIQKEIKNVRDNMSFMKGLNQKLSEDLKQFNDFQNGRLTNQSKSEFPYQRKLATRSCAEPESINSASTSRNPCEKGEEEMGGVLARVPDLLHGSTPSMKESSSKSDKYVQAVTSDNDVKKRRKEICYEDEIRKADERVRQLEDEDESVRRQLKKLIVNMESLKADSNEMKQELRKLSSPLNTGSELFFKTTMFTDKVLREMKRRDQVKHNTSRADSVLMVHDVIAEAPATKTTCTNLATRSPAMESSPCNTKGPPEEASAQLLIVSRENTTQGQVKLKEQSKTAERQTPKGELETQTPPSSLESDGDYLNVPARFRDSLHEEMNYGIQRYIVRSSETIAKLRDLTPQEITYYTGY